MIEPSDSAYTAVVTGASGYVASEIVKQLLEKGYNVRATVRSLSDKHEYGHLEALAAALPGVLALYEADLLKKGSFDKAISGSDFVFHTASPIGSSSGGDLCETYVLPAVNGTKNVLASVVKFKDTVKRVVFTSSAAEKDWDLEATMESEVGEYSKELHMEVQFLETSASDIRAEKVAWELSQIEGFELVSINPVLVWGPILSARLDSGISAQTMAGMIEGRNPGHFADDVMNSLFHFCDVRDVARAHILGAENPNAKGQRFIIAHGETLSKRFATDVLKKRFPKFKIEDGEGEPSSLLYDNTNALKVLGLRQLHSPERTIIDMAVTMIQKGMAKPQSA